MLPAPLFLLAISLVLLTGCSVQQTPTKQAAVENTSSESRQPLPTIAEWQIYDNDRYWLAMKIPPEYQAHSSREKGNRSPREEGRPPMRETVSFTAPGQPSFALTVFSGVPEGVSVASLTHDPRCGTSAPDAILLQRVLVTSSIRFVEKEQRRGDVIDIDHCFLNRQRYVLSLHAWGLRREDLPASRELLRKVRGTLELRRG